MTEVKRLLAALLDDDRHIFVFPSEVAADFWRRESLRPAKRRAIWEDRFLSWDRFKEETFKLSQRAAPVNRVIRMLFAADLLEQNAGREPIFASLVGREYADGSRAFLQGLTSVLPELKRYREMVERPAVFGAIDAGTQADLDLLWRRYHDFLHENGLFEPSYDRIDVSALTKDYHVFFPEVIEDWREALPFLESRRIHPFSMKDAPPGPIMRFENSVQELRSLCREISLLLEKGNDPTEIAVTVPRLETWESVLRRDAELMGIPLDIRQGRTLAEYPEVRFFFRLSECDGGGYTIEGLKSLFECRAYPWRHRRAGETLVRWGIEHHCAGRYRSGGALRDPWLEKLALGGDGTEAGASVARSMKGFYSDFTRDVGGLVRAPGFGVLRNRLQRFINTWLDTDQWKPESRRIFQFALNALNDLIEADRRIVGITVADPYSLWLAVLGERLYVPRSGAAGIPVYPYRVSAGIAPARHFILGATQLGTQVEWRPLSFLREDERTSLGVQDTSATEEFLRLYLNSGSRVSLSFSDQDVSGVELPPGYFVMRRAVERPATLAAEREADGYLREAQIWTGCTPCPDRVYAVQKEAVRYFMRVGGGRREGDITGSPLGDTLLRERLIERLSDESGRLRISPTRLDRFWECPFGFLFSTVLGVEDRAYSIEWSDPRMIGSLMHEILKRLFGAIDMSDGRFDPHHIEDYRRMLFNAIAATYKEYEARGEAFVPPVWNSLRPHLADRLARLLDAEAVYFGGLTVEALEGAYSRERATVRLEGRIDRVSGDESGVLLVDYKRNTHVRKGDLLGRGGASSGDDSEEFEQEYPSTFQIPFYVTLVEAQGRRVSSAAYYSIEKAKFDLVFDEGRRKAWFRREALDRLLAATEDAIREMESRVRRGAWMIPDLKTGCDECRLRSVCRIKYSVR